MAKDAAAKPSKAVKAKPSSSKPSPKSSQKPASKAEKYKSSAEISSDDEEDDTSSTASSASSDSDSGSASASESESESEAESASASTTTSSSTPSSKPSEKEPSPPPTAKYTLPAGAKPLAIPPASSAASNPFSPQNLQGKQVWLITAPASVPLQTVLSNATTTFPASALLTGQPVLEHKSTRYGLVADDADEDDTETTADGKNKEDKVSGLSVLIPREGTQGKYRVASIPITKSLHLTAAPPNTSLPPHLILPPLPDFSPETASISLRPVRPARDQPHGLKMRFHPFGAGASIPGDEIFGGAASDTDDAAASGKGGSGRNVGSGNAGKAQVLRVESDTEMGGTTPKRRKVSKEGSAAGKKEKEKEKKHKKKASVA